ncbi:MAG TPA: BamA/TamA family outer membrane protein [Flavobacterium sp.]|uniref:translocation and assembly module lipoprotein TamL n=1 Tax=Flavobacterium sp. TaxID=239 RepID=UPI002BE71FD2|nr:BamA/TamA family outer membrane protein [Flavobacterium sp.]MCA0349956.1 outer membrane protein assembly factor [Bacteroidota bacterium]HPW97398.1 BamA/TamA family outer membrane protein [Flavobacterium sp.]HQA74179.1 BamA/TamA family outer membrane protein [Flavobacterium sp.]
MKFNCTKIVFIILSGLFLFSCNTTKRVPDGKKLLVNNTIEVDEQKEKSEEVFNQLYQKQNSSILGYKLRLNIYNLAKQKTDSIYRAKFINNPKKYYRKSKWLSRKQVKRLGESFWYSGIHNFLMKTGEAPVILDTASTKKSLRRLRLYYSNIGYFDAKAKFTIDTIAAKKAKLNYSVTKGKPYIIDSIATIITTKVLDSIYQEKKNNSYIKVGDQFNRNNFENERNRITEDFRNNGAFKFQQNYINYEIDTIKRGHKPKITILIDDEVSRVNDSTVISPFKLYKINRVNIFTDHSTANPNAKITDSAVYKNFNIYSVNKLKYRLKSITNGVFIAKDNYFSDFKTAITSRYLTNLKVFNYPLIQYVEDKNDQNGLIANIYLTPRKKYTFGFSTDFTHSNIQDFGISGTTFLSIRNVFNGTETFDLGFRGNIGSSRDLANPNDNFFNISEIGIDAKLNFPKLILPFKTEKIIPKRMIPYTTLSVGYAKQRNVGLDKQNFTSSFTYNWTPKRNVSFKFDLINIQFVKNLNPTNYFNIYTSSYNALNDIAQNYPVSTDFLDANGNLKIDDGTSGFLVAAFTDPSLNLSTVDLKSVLSILERRVRLTENNLIFSSNITYSKTSKKDIFDNNFYAFKTKFESAGNLLSLFSRISKQLKSQSGANTFFEVEYSQYIKSELEYIRHWGLSSKQVFAVKGFFGIAIPYGNSNSIPFSRSYFGGGSNDIRAWQSYSLGPGSSESILDFNEANMKLTLSSEFRFNVFGNLYSAVFVDAGNIWNVLDNISNEKSVFSGVNSLKDIAVGTGFGLRYDFNFFVLRTDFGFKTYNPANPENEKWFKDIRFDKSVLNIGINYPF